MQLNSIAISSKSITMKVSANKETDDVNDIIVSTITAKEEPLESLTKAWAELPKVFCEIMELTETDAKGKPHYPYATGLVVTKLSIRRTKMGTRSIVMEATKQLECRKDFLHTITSPCVQIEASTDGESGAVEIDKEMADKVMRAIHQSEQYLAGERSQKLLDFDQAKAGLNAVAELGKDELGLGVGS